MSKIAIIGHPASGYQEVEALLHQYGMGRAQPSRRDGLSPLQITATLCQAHKTPPLDTVVDEEEIRQIDAGAIWHGLALDLMLGNLDQPLWGWADPQAIYTLDYWSGLDPQMRFVLVYDEPHRVLMEAARAEGPHPSIDSLRRLLDNWAAYNGVLLHFYLRHPGRCLLIHARQTQQAAGHCLRQLQNLLDAPLALPAEEQDPAQPLIENTEQSGAAAPSAVNGVLSRLTQAEHLKPEDLSAVANATATERYLADGVLADYPKALQLYAELQSAASLPLDKAARAAASAASAWETWVRQRAFVFDLLSNIHAQYRTANDALAAAHKQIEDKTAALADLHRQIEYKQTESRQENQLLLTQLQQAQLKLEAEHKQAQDQAAALADLQRQIEHKQAEGSQENELLLSQLFQVQEELERHHLENQRLKDAGQRAANDAQAALKQAQDKAAALAAAQKQVADKDTALATARKQAEDKAAALADLQQQIEHKQAESSQENELLLSQMFQVQEELERHHLENQLLLSQLHQVQKELERYGQEKNPPKPPGPLGAAARIKEQLTYRLGAVMISHNTLGGWLTLPWALAAETRAFRKERRARGPVKRPPIHTYLDAAEAERVKQHLSYRLGSVLIQHAKSPPRWFTLPFALRREVREFRRTRKTASK